ncbi:MAG: hypothetical protein VKK94_04575 [Cyanobacteriota bacterium]|nr:hypothetical protein [Cyanobacteriota bacterium]
MSDKCLRKNAINLFTVDQQRCHDLGHLNHQKIPHLAGTNWIADQDAVIVDLTLKFIHSWAGEPMTDGEAEHR